MDDEACNWLGCTDDACSLLSNSNGLRFCSEHMEWFQDLLHRYTQHVCNTERAEVVNGQQVVWPNRHEYDGVVAFNASFWLDTYLQQHRRGRTFRPAPRFLLQPTPTTIRVPDVAFIAAHRIAQYTAREVWSIPPDLIVEVLTDGAREAEVDQRISDFFKAGTPIAWIVDARDKICCVKRANGDTRVFGYSEKIYSAPALPRLNLRVYELFGE
jgi:Uma2 family endonuclease